jgi:uncharacterized membrane protein YeaQ/YmgE (transglycosylase-associated protein family)
MSIIVVLIMGLIVGALARLVVPGKEPGGWLVSLALGVGGALLGTFVGRAMGMYHEGESSGFIMSLLGAVVLTAGYAAISRRRRVA